MRYLQQAGSGYVFPWTDTLAKRPDMKEVDALVADAVKADTPQPRQESVVVTGEAPDGNESTPQSDAMTILSFNEKDELEAFAREKGIELDKRRSLANMKSDALEALGLA
jgi:hypothetical protein